MRFRMPFCVYPLTAADVLLQVLPLPIHTLSNTTVGNTTVNLLLYGWSDGCLYSRVHGVDELSAD